MNGRTSHWGRVSLGEVFEILDGRRIPVNSGDRSQRHGTVPYYGATGQVGWIDDFLFDEELVLLGEDGAPFLDFGRPKAYVVKGQSWVNNHAHVLRPPEGTSVAFWKHQLDLVDYRPFVSGTTRLKLPQGPMRQITLTVPPIPEQERIVEALDSYLSRLDESVALLERVQRNLKRYRASVLHAAVTGKLVPTEAELARAEGRDYEPASVLLERILAERRRRWAESGKKGKYEEPAAPDTTGLPELPEGWCWALLDALAEVKGGITKNQRRESSEPLRDVPYLRVANVQRGYLDLTTVATIPATEAEIEDLRLAVGDVLFNEGGDRDKLGRGWVWNGELPTCIHQNHVFRARIYTPDLSPKFLSWHGNTNGQRYFFDEGKQTTNLASINMTKLRGLPVPLPPVAEQARIEEAVDEALSEIDATARQVATNLTRCTRLRQSILKWAFEGKLADQDPADEPAADLLARIKADRAAAAAAPKAPGRGRKKTP